MNQNPANHPDPDTDDDDDLVQVDDGVFEDPNVVPPLPVFSFPNTFKQWGNDLHTHKKLTSRSPATCCTCKQCCSRQRT